IVLGHGHALSFQHLPMATPATGIAGRQPALLVDYSLPGQIRVAKMGNSANNASRPGITAQCRQLTVGHHPALRDLSHDGLDPMPKPGFIVHQNSPSPPPNPGSASYFSAVYRPDSRHTRRIARPRYRPRPR